MPFYGVFFLFVRDVSHRFAGSHQAALGLLDW